MLARRYSSKTLFHDLDKLYNIYLYTCNIRIHRQAIIVYGYVLCTVYNKNKKYTNQMILYIFIHNVTVEKMIKLSLKYFQI